MSAARSFSCTMPQHLATTRTILSLQTSGSIDCIVASYKQLRLTKSVSIKIDTIVQARFLLAKLNPSSTYASAEGSMGMGGGSEIIMTDDVSLQVSSMQES